MSDYKVPNPQGTVATIEGTLNWNSKKAKGRYLGTFRFWFKQEYLPVLTWYGWVPNKTKFLYSAHPTKPYLVLTPVESWSSAPKSQKPHTFKMDGSRLVLFLTSEEWRKGRAGDPNHKVKPSTQHRVYLLEDRRILCPLTLNMYHLYDDQPYLVKNYQKFFDGLQSVQPNGGYDHRASIEALIKA